MVFNTPRRCRYTVIGLGYNLSHATSRIDFPKRHFGIYAKIF